MDSFLHLLEYPLEHHWADVFGIIGFPLALYGIVLTMKDARNAKTAAQQAKEEVGKLRGVLLQVDTIQNLSEAVTIMEEIKRLHRYDVWDYGLLERYSSLKRKLIKIRSDNKDLQDTQLRTLQGSIQHMSDIEDQVERSLKTTSALNTRPSVPRLNKIISSEMQKIDELLAFLKMKVGE